MAIPAAVTAAALAAGIGAAGNVTGGLASGALNYVYNKKLQTLSQEFNAAEAQKARDFEERMSSTAYQRAKADLMAAGLNPALAYSQGGASTPSGEAASASAGHAGQPNLGDFTGLISTLINTASKERMLDRKLDAQEQMFELYRDQIASSGKLGRIVRQL